VAPPELLFVAAASSLVVAGALWRAFVEHRRTANAVTAWVRQERAAPVPGLALRALRVEHGFPLAAIAGVIRPRLLLANQVVDALTPAELQAVAAHEAGHLEAGDVLKRLLLRLCPDPLPWTRTRRRLESEWERASEAAADEFAGRRVSRIVLAKALVKIASLVPPGRRLLLELPAFAAGASVAVRVRHLLEDDGAAARHPAAPGVRVLPLLAVAAAAAIWLVALPVILPATHALLETLVRGVL
jgi:Zn-dependent protease with chaperone function